MEATLHVVLQKVKPSSAAEMTAAFHRMEGSYLRSAAAGFEVFRVVQFSFAWLYLWKDDVDAKVRNV